ncbi:hypothetical protein D3C75_654110 [compost metagenome]
MQAHRFIRVLRMLITAETDRVIELHAAVRSRRRIKFVNTQLLECLPVFDHHIGVNQRRFDIQAQIGFLLFRRFWHQIRDHHVVTGHDRVAPFHAVRFAVVNVGHNHAVVGIFSINHNTVKTDSGGVFRVVELFVIEPRGDRILHGMSG